MKALNIQRCLLYVSAFLYTLVANADTHNLTFNLSDFQFVQNDTVVTILTNNVDYIFESNINKPAIPIMPLQEVAYGTYKEGSLDIQIEEMTLLFSDIYIAPNNASFSDTIITNVICDEYNDSVYPAAKPVAYSFSGHERDGKTKLFFNVSPFVYDVKNKCLYFISSLYYSYDIEPSHSYTSVNNTNALDYLIITSSMLEETFLPLKHWKTKKGVKTEILTVEEIYDSYPQGNSDQEKIKYCIYDYYKNKGVQWVLLGGDVEVVPAQMCHVQYNRSRGDTLRSSVASDLYYAAFDGNFCWDADSDNIYAELEDSINLYPNVKISRLPMWRIQEVSDYVNKLLQYEKNPNCDGSLDKMLMMGKKTSSDEPENLGGRSDVHRKGEIIFSSYIQPYASNISKKNLYDTGNDFGYTDGFTANNIINAINYEKPHYLFVQTHGDDNIWSVTNGFFEGMKHVGTIQNADYPMVVVTTACKTNNFVSTSLSESFINHPKGGAIAYWGSSDSGFDFASYLYMGPSPTMCAHFWRRLFAGENNFLSVVNAAKEDLISVDNTSYINPYRWLQLSMNAVGDAEVPIYTRTPSIIDDAEIHVSPTSVNVTTDSTAYIAITSTSDNGNSIYKTANATSCSYNTTTPLSVCLTRKNHVPLLIEGGGIYESMGYACLYLQNATFPSSSTTYHSENAYIGSSSGGNVVVENSGELVIDSDIKTVVYGGLHCKKGGKLVIK